MNQEIDQPRTSDFQNHETRMVNRGTWSLLQSLQLLNWFELLPSSRRPKMCFKRVQMGEKNMGR